MGNIKPAAPPFIAARWHGGDQTPALSVIHSTVSPCRPGGAEDIAQFFAHHSEPTSAHYTIDPEAARQCVHDHTVAYHCGYNDNSLAYEMCDVPGPVPGDKPGTAAYRALRRVWRWRRPEQKLMLQRTARMVARNHLAYGIPIRFLGVRGLRRWDARGQKPEDGGITTHAYMSRTFHRSVHWDPGFWPRRRFVKMVRAEAAKIRKAGH